ncbi:hypothetical protein Tcan_00851, partial [Toxocara canis]
GCTDRVKRCSELNVGEDCKKDIYKVFCGRRCGTCQGCDNVDFCPSSSSSQDCRDPLVRAECTRTCRAC